MADDANTDIPVWFQGTQRWMTGLTKRTTCDDVIYALLVNSGLHETESTDSYAIFEKWREVERPLSARTKIFKIWSFWGEEQPNVQLSMRNLDDYFLPGESALYLRSRRRHRKSSKGRDRRFAHCKCHNKRGCTECSRLRSLEQLVKLVVSQERKIQDLRDRIHDTDRLIEKHESRIHTQRVQQNGLDYVQNSYLNSHSGSSASNSSTSSTDSSGFSSLELKDLSIIFRSSSVQELEEITRVCDKMAYVDNRIPQEYSKINELTQEVEKLSKALGVNSNLETEANASLEEARVQMIRAVTTHVTNEFAERELDRRLDIATRDLAARRVHMEDIERKLLDLGKTSERILDGTPNQRYDSTLTDQNNIQIFSDVFSAQALCSQEREYHDSGCRPWMHPESENIPLAQQEYTADDIDFSWQDGDLHVKRAHMTKKDSLKNISSNLTGTNSSSSTFTPAEVYSDHQKIHPGNRSKRSIFHTQLSGDIPPMRRARDTHHQPAAYSRSRSAERPSMSNAHREFSPNISSFEVTMLGGRGSDRKGFPSKEECPVYTANSARSIVCQYGLELGSGFKGHNISNDLANQQSSHSYSCEINSAVTESQLKNRPHQQNKAQVHTECEPKLFEQKQHSQHRTPYADNGNLISQNNSQDSSVSSNQRNGARMFFHVCPAGFRRSLSTGHCNEKRNVRFGSLNTTSDLDVGKQDLSETVLESRSPFKKNMNGLSTTKSCSNVQGQIANSGELSSTVNKPFNLSNVLGRHLSADLKQHQHHRQNPAFTKNIAPLIHTEVNEKQTEVQQTKNFAFIPDHRSSRIMSHDKQTDDHHSFRQTQNMYIQGQKSTRQAKLNEYSRQNPEDFSFVQVLPQNNHLSDCQRKEQDKHFQAQQNLSGPYSKRDIPDTISRIQTNSREHTIWSENCEAFNQIKLDNDPQKCGSTYQPPRSMAAVKSDGDYRLGCLNPLGVHYDSAVSQSDAVNYRNLCSITDTKISGNSSPATRTDTSGKYDGFASTQSSNRGALYHIVSNKMNKSKSESAFNQFNNNGKNISSNTRSNQQSDRYKQKSAAITNVEPSPNKEDIPSTDTNKRSPHSSVDTSYFPHISEKITGQHTSLNCHIYDAVTDSQNDSQQSRYNSNNIDNNTLFSTDVTFQNSINQNNKCDSGLHKLIKSGRLFSKLEYPTDHGSEGFIFNNKDTVNIQDINENREFSQENYADGHGYHTYPDLSISNHLVRDRTKIEDINDSNSDTGLSSMHSDEIANIETLV